MNAHPEAFKRYHIYLPESLYEAISARAQERYRSTSQEITLAVDLYLSLAHCGPMEHVITLVRSLDALLDARLEAVESSRKEEVTP